MHEDVTLKALDVGMRSIPYLLPQPVSWAHSYRHSAGEM